MMGAIESFRNAVAINPGLAIAHYNLGVVLEQEGQYEEAIEQVRGRVRARFRFGVRFMVTVRGGARAA